MLCQASAGACSREGDVTHHRADGVGGRGPGFADQEGAGRGVTGIGERRSKAWSGWQARQNPWEDCLGTQHSRAVCTASRSCYLIITTELHTLKLSLECKGHGGEDVSSTAALNSKTRYKALLQKSLFWKLLRTSTTVFSPMHPNSVPQSPSLRPRCPCWSPRPTAVLPHLSKVLLFYLQKACETQRPPFHFSLWILLTSGTHEIPGLLENNCFSGDLNT